MKQPTEEQIKEFWEWCGFNKKLNVGYYGATGELPNGKYANLNIDLNNLFKYALPMLGWFIVDFEHIEVSCDYYVTLTDFYLAQPSKKYKSQAKDPALALFWALFKVMKNASKN